MTVFLLLWVAWQPIWVSGLGYENRNPPVGLLTKTLTRPRAGFLAGTHGLGRALASSKSAKLNHVVVRSRRLKPGDLEQAAQLMVPKPEDDSTEVAILKNGRRCPNKRATLLEKP
jgi:hypothetical protein